MPLLSLLRRAAVIALASLCSLGCQTRQTVETPPPPGPPALPPPGVPSGAALCQAYIEIPNAHAWCVYRNIRTVLDLKEMKQACAQAGAWTDDCRQEWVHIQLERKAPIPRQDLLEACAGNEDCSLVVLDTVPIEDPLLQFTLCEKHAGHFASDCAGHALERWWTTRPSIQDLSRMASAATPFPNELGRVLAASKVCRQQGDCAGDPAMVPWCEQWAAKFTADPRGCPP